MHKVNGAADTHIYVVTHKQTVLPEDEGYIPIVVGNHSISYDHAVYDNTGINIADKNSSYCELTALYWVWKNAEMAGGYGLCHYRRFFHNKSVKGKNTLEFKRIPRYFKKYDIVLPLPLYWGENTVERQFIDTSISQYNFDLIREAISALYPEYIPAYTEVFSSHYASYCNMFIMPSKEMLNDYCQWLFDILFYIEQHADLSETTDYEKRIYGFISERLLNVWVRKNNLKVKFLRVGQSNTRFRLIDVILDKLVALEYGVYGNGRISRFIASGIYSVLIRLIGMVRKDSTMS